MQALFLVAVVGMCLNALTVMFLCPITTLKQERLNYCGVITVILGDRIREIVLNAVLLT